MNVKRIKYFKMNIPPENNMVDSLMPFVTKSALNSANNWDLPAMGKLMTLVYILCKKMQTKLPFYTHNHAFKRLFCTHNHAFKRLFCTHNHALKRLFFLKMKSTKHKQNSPFDHNTYNHTNA